MIYDCQQKKNMKTFKFGQHSCPFSQVFFTTKYTLGFVNLKPIVPGHVLLIPRRELRRFHELSSEEVSDLYLSAQKVGKVLEREFKCSSLSISMQDGIEAGQSVFHVHVHILPRRVGDFKRNDDIYEHLDKHGSSMNDDLIKGVDATDDQRPPRTQVDMEKEAKWLRSFFEQHEETEFE